METRYFDSISVLYTKTHCVMQDL